MLKLLWALRLINFSSLSSIKHFAYVTRVHYNSTYAGKLRHENFALDKISESASPPLWLRNFHGFNSVSNSWTPKKVAALRSLKIRHLFQRKKLFTELTEAERNRLLVETQAKSTKNSTSWAVNAFKGMNLRKHDELQCNTHLKH